ncbi:Methyltransferase domain-containing protein [Colletotrichum higginsianum IMI 349063]|uniref:Methyltransferase domain-containing protein n=3 Tax=Colletotrichum higginsianum TaxID=80884 RepID=A0A1B7YI81_COLHI|nr:Methyltransferase domain-containing protein [Colletotrichum higginsianum IMI 349063]OBR11584.1 Methyltransferase domain-containing protein [Colletotrichum higginsianum IMI 349063]TIC99147.1 hypothetical protein CH35J_006235 [Colletotrichum higginsianum]GJC93237.1 methyltransferase domain-containing protein [Colletotrichum higginsianum]
MDSNLMPSSYPHQLHVLSAPLSDDDALPASWNHNKSTYTIDCALWTACKESRAAMHRRYNIHHWTNLCDHARRPLLDDSSHLRIRHQDYEDLPATFPVRDKDNWQYITVLPRRDLIIVQVLDVADFTSLEHHDLFSSMHHGFVSFADIAVEFDPSWSCEELHQYNHEWINGSLRSNWDDYDRARWATYYQLLLAMKEMRNTRLWMMDRRLGLESKALDRWSTRRIAQKEWESCFVFRGEGCTYYQMPGGWDFCLNETDKDDDACCDFASQLGAVCMEQLEKDFDEDDLYNQFYQPWRVLVCDKV